MNDKITRLELRQRRLIQGISYFQPRIEENIGEIHRIVGADALKSAADKSLALLCTSFTLMMLQLSEVNGQLEDARGKTTIQSQPPTTEPAYVA